MVRACTVLDTGTVTPVMPARKRSLRHLARSERDHAYGCPDCQWVGRDSTGDALVILCVEVRRS
jgi:hypothetical protein